MDEAPQTSPIVAGLAEDIIIVVDIIIISLLYYHHKLRQFALF
jgi:hypothetical protein